MDFQEGRDFEGFKFEILRVFASEIGLDEKDFFNMNAEEITTNAFEQIKKNYKEKQEFTSQRVYLLSKIFTKIISTA